MDHRFDGPRYTVGIEEELMIVDSSSLDLVNAIESILGEDPPSGQIQPELLESVLEIATAPCATVAAAGDELASLRALARDRARARAWRSAPRARTRSRAGRTSGWSATTATAA